MARRRRKGKFGKWVGRLLSVLLALPALYMIAALAGSLLAVNRGWREPSNGTTVYIADNGIHTDIIMPVDAQGLDWAPILLKHDFASVDPSAKWIALGAGNEKVYLSTPTWWDLTPNTVWSALLGGREVIHAEYVTSPRYAEREIHLRPEEYRRLWAALRSGFALDSKGRPKRIDHPGYGSSDAFYLGNGKTSLFVTCNSWLAHRLRLAGIKASIWPPFAPGLLWRYRRITARSD